MDPATKETNDIIKKIEDRISVEYRQAARELAERVTDYWKRFDVKDKKWRQWVADGQRTEAEYKQWLSGQLMTGQRWEEMRDTIAEDLTNVDQIAKSIAYGYMPEVYALNHAYGTYEIETGAMVNTSYTLYSRESLEFLFRENPQLLPDPGKSTADDIARGKAVRWNNQRLQSVMAQAILQGNSIPDIATRLMNAVGDSNRKAAVRNARTMATYTQNAGRIDAYKRGEELGIQSKKQWIATLDMRTRHNHRVLDGMAVGLDDYFEVEGEKIFQPGDPKASPSMVYNCRCTLRAKLEGWVGAAASQRSLVRLEEAGLTYEEWKKSRVEKPNPQLLPEQKQDAIRAQYIRQYRGRGGPVASGRNTKLNVDYRG